MTYLSCLCIDLCVGDDVVISTPGLFEFDIDFILNTDFFFSIKYDDLNNDLERNQCGISNCKHSKET